MKDPEETIEANAKDLSFGSNLRIMYNGSNLYCVCYFFLKESLSGW